MIAFDARLSGYYKGYISADEHDYKLGYLSKIKLVNSQVEHRPMPLENSQVVGYIMKENKDFYLKKNRPYDEWYVGEYERWAKKNR